MNTRSLFLCGVLALGLPIAAAAQRPDVKNPHGPLPVPCAACHSAQAWVPAHVSSAFDHARAGKGFVLEGAHATVACKSCHTSLTFQGASRDCVSCHKDPHQGEVGTACARCHTMRSFVDRTAMTRAHQLTRFPLTGAHVTADCESCHARSAQGQLTFTTRSTGCNDCHLKDYQSAKTPDHAGGNFSHTCEQCHATVAWQTAKFDHNTTGFALTGFHLSMNCAQCHGGAYPAGALPTTCVGCHQKDYTGAATPNHAQAQFSTDCTGCHTTASWAGANFNHNTTAFPLTGAHVQATCDKCHGDGVFKGKSTTCVSCHQTDYDNATTPNHAQAQFPTDCTACHTTMTWTGANFNHNATAFPLTGAHIQATCTQCHGDGVYKGKPTTCVSCHQTDFNNAKDPNHAQAQFSSDCTACHTTTTWSGATFNHNTTAFPLTGAHVQLTCDQCHSDGVYKGKPTTCVSCHQTDFNNTTLPNHAQAQFPTDCTACHTTTTWSGATFNHNTTAFPLTGAHVQLTCDQCHSDGVYKGKPTTCVSCHQTDYNNTTNPNHAAAQFPTDCTLCHATTSFTTATFNHANTAFPLTGAHLSATCAQCHGDGVYKGKPTTCVSCHQTDFTNTSNPNHAQAQFSTDCVACHTTTVWTTATYTAHDAQYFPIYSGNHRGRWNNDCSTCHINPSDYRQFDCIQCHRNVHSGKGYTNQQCYSCHPRGSS
jgi:hypothetical protein